MRFRPERDQGRPGKVQYEECLRELGMFSLEKINHVTMFQGLQGGCKEDGDSLF